MLEDAVRWIETNVSDCVDDWALERLRKSSYNDALLVPIRSLFDASKSVYTSHLQGKTSLLVADTACVCSYLASAIPGVPWLVKEAARSAYESITGTA